MGFHHTLTPTFPLAKPGIWRKNAITDRQPGAETWAPFGYGSRLRVRRPPRRQQAFGARGRNYSAGAKRHDLIPLNTEELAASLRELTGELGKLFGDIRRVGGFELQQVQVGLEISAEGGFNLIGSAKAGGKGAITLTFAPGTTPGA